MYFCPHCAQPLVARTFEERPYLACPDAACGFVHWDNPVPVVMAVVEYLAPGETEGRILLARNRAWAEGTLGLIAGYLEKGEWPEAAAVRELREETGLVAETAALIGNYFFERKNQVLLAYHLRAGGEIRLNEELAEYRLFAPDAVPPLPTAIGRIMADWLRRRYGLDYLPAP
ncbi:NUDIX domain-containing protein [Denitratisoma sp. agr-D3]